MTFFLSNWKSISAFALATVLLLGAYQHGVETTADKYELQITAKELSDAKAREQARIKNDTTIARLQGEKYDAQKRIDALAADNKRYRVLLPGCGRVVPVPGTPAAGRDIQESAGGKPLSDTAESQQAALDRFMEGEDNAALYADTVVSDCRVVMEWAKNLCKTNNSCQERN